MNPTRTPRSRGLTRRLAFSLTVFAATAAFAQVAGDTTKPDETLKLEKFVVTGSLIPATQGETFIPVSTYTATKLTLLGAATPIEGLRSLPSFFGASDTELDSNGGSGAATVNLRGLGGTLTLVNGRRSGVTEGVGFSDLNLMPIDAIQSIDILKDGAGSVYGADALAGVVNIVLKKKWNGTQLRAGYGVSGENDAQQWDVSLALGRSFDHDKGYVNLVAAYAAKETLYACDRGISALADGRPLGGQNGGSPTFAGRVGAAGGGLMLNTGKDFPSSPADYHAFNPNTESFNFREYSPSIPGQTRKLLHFAAGYELFGRQVEPYVEFDYADQFTSNGLAPAPFTLPNATARDSRYRINEHLAMLAQLTRVDGALVIDEFLRPIGFSAVIKTTPEWTGPVINMSRLTLGPVDLTKFGTRHRSAVTFVANCSGAIAFGHIARWCRAGTGPGRRPSRFLAGLLWLSIPQLIDAGAQLSVSGLR